MIPTLPPRPLRLHPRILNRNPLPNAFLPHGRPKQPALILPLSSQPIQRTHPILSHQPQFLTRIAHGPELPLQLQLGGLALLAFEQHPGAVDGPVAEVAETGEAEGTWAARFEEEVAD